MIQYNLHTLNLAVVKAVILLYMLQEMAVQLFFYFRYSCKVPDLHLTGKKNKHIVAKPVETARE